MSKMMEMELAALRSLANKEEMEKLVALLTKAVKWGSFTLSQGRQSDFYFDGQQASLSSGGCLLLGRLLMRLVAETGVMVKVVCGPAMGAVPLLAAMNVLSEIESPEAGLPAFYDRKALKGHGLDKPLEGDPPTEKGPVVVVEDIITTGQSVLNTINVIEAAGYKVTLVVALLDRQEGGCQALREKEYRVRCLLSRKLVEYLLSPEYRTLLLKEEMHNSPSC